MGFHHISVLLNETTDALHPVDGGIYVDCTLGGGGHSERLLSMADCTVVGLDRDADAIAAASERLARFGDRFRPVRTTFAELPAALASLGLDQVDGILADFGVSSHQLDIAERGFRSVMRAPSTCVWTVTRNFLQKHWSTKRRKRNSAVLFVTTVKNADGVGLRERW